MKNPKWIEDPDLLDGPVGQLNGREIYFFQDLITEYLFPLDSNKKREEKVAIELKDLKNKASFAFLLLNAIFVVVVFTLQIQKNESGLSIPWPCGNNLNLEPIGFVFLVFFGSIMFIQICGMVMHRVGTFLHIVATTVLDLGKTRQPDEVGDALALAARLGKVNNDDAMSVSSVTTTGTDNDTDAEPWKRRKNVLKLTKQVKKGGHEPKTLTIDAQFKKRFDKLQNKLQDDDVDEEQINQALFGKEKGTRAYRSKTIKAIRHLRELNQGRRSRTNTEVSTLPSLPRNKENGQLSFENKRYSQTNIQTMFDQTDETKPPKQRQSSLRMRTSTPIIAPSNGTRVKEEEQNKGGITNIEMKSYR